jgi:hypothetical protein
MLSPAEIGGPDSAMQEFRVSAAADPVCVVVVSGGGIISYRKPTGEYVHTLCDESGFARKLNDLGININHGAEV